jgi:transcriptional regulator with XRE-family HTH domain
MEVSIAGVRIKEKREKAGWTQVKLAEIAGVTASAISQIENGERHPSTVVLHKLAKALSTSVNYLLGGKDEEDLSDILQDKNVEILFRKYKDLPKTDQENILEYIKFKTAKSKKKF